MYSIKNVTSNETLKDYLQVHDENNSTSLIKQVKETKFDSIVIGGGLGGLIAGAKLSKMGRKVLLLEQHYIPGGCATTFKRKDFVLEVGLHELDGLHKMDTKYEIFEYLDIFKNIEFLKVPEFFHLTRSDFSFTFPHNEGEATDKLIESFPEDENGIKKFFRFINGVLSDINGILRMPQSELISALIYPFMPLLFPFAVQSMNTSVGEWLDQNIKNERLKLILAANTFYYGDDPYDLSMMYFSMGNASYIGGGGYFIKGGSQKLSDYLVSLIENAGGQVLLGKLAFEIIVDHNQAVGVKFRDTFNRSADHNRAFSDTIIANAAVPNVLKMLPDECAQKFERKINKLEEACSLLTIYMGFNIDLKEFGVKHYTTFFQEEDIQTLKDLKKNYRGSWEQKFLVLTDYSQIDASLCPKGKSVAVLCSVDYLSEWEGLDEAAYKNKKEEVARCLLNRLEKYYPGIMSHLEYYEVGTAKTIQNFTLNPKGTPYGYAQKLSQTAERRKFKLPKVKNLYFASSWTFPGGGFTGTIVSGSVTADKIAGKPHLLKNQYSKIEDERQVKLLHKRFVADNTIELTFEKPKSFDYQAGQYVILKLDKVYFNELDMPIRMLSIVSHPKEGTLKFAMRLSHSSYKRNVERMQEGDLATIFGPIGNFQIDENDTEIIFLISGIGITPVIPMLKEMVLKKQKRKVKLFYTNKSPETSAYHDELKSVELVGFTYYPVYTSTGARIDESFLKQKIDNLNNCTYYIVGTNSFIESMKKILSENNVNSDKVKVDDFG